MGIISWIIFGLIAGGIARWLTPGPNPAGCLVTIALGIAGSMVGGFIGRAIGLYGDNESTGGIFMSIIGAVIILLIYRALTGPKPPV